MNPSGGFSVSSEKMLYMKPASFESGEMPSKMSIGFSSASSVIVRLVPTWALAARCVVGTEPG